MDIRHQSAVPHRTVPVNRSAWRTGGGFVGVLALIHVLLAFYLVESDNSHNLAGAFLLHGIAIMFFVGSVPAFVVGAAVGAIAARRSTKAAAIAVGTYAVLIMVIGASILVIPALVQRVRSEAFLRAASVSQPVRTALPTAEVIEIRQEQDGLVLSRSRPDSSQREQFRCQPGEDGQFVGGVLDVSGSTVRLSWPQTNLFEVNIDVEPGGGTGIIRIEANDVGEPVATIDGVLPGFPIEVRAMDRQQHVVHVVVRGRLQPER